jgi:hypothetical protein
VRAARDAVRAPVLEALQGPRPLPGAGGVGVETMLTAIDGIAVDGIRYDPEQPLLARQKELAAFALAPFAGRSNDGGEAALPTVRRSTETEEIEGLLDRGAAGEAALELVVREAASLRDGPSLWRVIAAVQRHRGAGQEVGGRAEALALEALGEAWFFGLALEDQDRSVGVLCGAKKKKEVIKT